MSTIKTISLALLLSLVLWGVLNLDILWQDITNLALAQQPAIQSTIQKVSQPQVNKAVVSNKIKNKDLVILGISNIDLQKIPIGYDHFSGEDTDKDGVPNKVELVLGLNVNKVDSDGDKVNDLQELKLWQNPLGVGRWLINLALINRLRGKLLLQAQGKGELWYVAYNKRYYIDSKNTANDFIISLLRANNSESSISLLPDTLLIESLDLNVPVIYVTETSDKVWQKGLERGVVHYPGTANPGEYGNVYIFGHSSDYRWRAGSYKRVFATLPDIKLGALIYISDKDGRVYKYKVFESKVVPATATEYLGQYEYKQNYLLCRLLILSIQP